MISTSTTKTRRRLSQLNPPFCVVFTCVHIILFCTRRQRHQPVHARWRDMQPRLRRPDSEPEPQSVLWLCAVACALDECVHSVGNKHATDIVRHCHRNISILYSTRAACWWFHENSRAELSKQQQQKRRWWGLRAQCTSLCAKCPWT